MVLQKKFRIDGNLKKQYIRYYIYIVLTLLAGMFNYVLIGQNKPSCFLLISVGYIPVALFMAFEKKLSLKFVWSALWLFGALWIFVRYMRYGYLSEHHSRNYVSITLFVLFFFYIYHRESCNKSISILWYVFFCVGCVMAIGRGGILAAGLNLILVIARRYIKIEENKRKLDRNSMLQCILLVVSVMLVASIILKNATWIELHVLPRFFVQNTTKSNMKRVMMLKIYLMEMKKLKSFAFGTNTMKMQYANMYAGNVHNAFLQTHAEFGIIGLIIVLYGAWFGCIRLFQSKYKETSIILLCFFVRSLTDDAWRYEFGTILVCFSIFVAIIWKNESKDFLIFE